MIGNKIVTKAQDCGVRSLEVGLLVFRVADVGSEFRSAM
jgi:hypothetical protein